MGTPSSFRKSVAPPPNWSTSREKVGVMGSLFPPSLVPADGSVMWQPNSSSHVTNMLPSVGQPSSGHPGLTIPLITAPVQPPPLSASLHASSVPTTKPLKQSLPLLFREMKK